MFENITHIEIFSTHENDKKIINQLLATKWQILAIVQNGERESHSFGQIILGASEEAFQLNNLDKIEYRRKRKLEERNKNRLNDSHSSFTFQGKEPTKTDASPLYDDDSFDEYDDLPF